MALRGPLALRRRVSELEKAHREAVAAGQAQLDDHEKHHMKLTRAVDALSERLDVLEAKPPPKRSSSTGARKKG